MGLYPGELKTGEGGGGGFNVGFYGILINVVVGKYLRRDCKSIWVILYKIYQTQKKVNVCDVL